MDKKAEAKRRWRQFRLRSSVFLKKNGLYVALAVCLAVIGGTAALIFAGNEKPNKQVEQSYDQQLGDVTDIDKDESAEVPASISPIKAVLLHTSPSPLMLARTL